MSSLFLALALVHATKVQASMPNRWLYLSMNLQVAENVTKAEKIVDRAKAAGYNGIVLTDYKLSILDQVPDFYFKNAAQVRDKIKASGLKLFAAVFGLGYSGGLLSHDPNLAEGLPVRDARFTVRNGVATLDPSPGASLVNGDFETSSGDRMSGYAFQDDIGKSTFADGSVFHGGKQSLRMEGIGKANPEYGNCRVHQEVTVEPWKLYHVSAWVKTEAFDRAGNARIAVLSGSGASLDFTELGLKPTEDWRQVHVVFNSQGNTKVRLYFGVWGGNTGRMWWDDAKVEQVGLVNLLRRAGCPLMVKGEDGTVFVEGKDYAKTSDPKMGTVPWPGSYEIFHEAPGIQIPSGSRIKDGQKLLVSYYTAAIVHGEQVTICLAEPKTRELLRQEFEAVNKLLQPDGFLMSHDEIRCGGWDETCRATKKTQGQLLAENIAWCSELIAKARPNASQWVWSDMFDPSHNAHGDYYLVSGTWEGSWLGLPSSVGVLNWHSGAAVKSLPFFAGRGHHQVLAGFYDGPVNAIQEWWKQGVGLKGIDGVMYTTWAGDYSKLEAFARAAWGK